MWIRVCLTGFALAVVLYLRFGFDMKDWIRNATVQAAGSSEVAPRP